MEFLHLIAIVLILFYLLKRYLTIVISFALTSYFRCESVKLQGCGLFYIRYVKFVFRNGISVELQSLRLSSSFLNQDHSKPISITLDDIRVESQCSLNSLDRQGLNKWKDESKYSGSAGDANKLFQFLQSGASLQYTGARINCANIVLLEAVPDCLLHVSVENLQLETYRYKEGLQIEVSFKLVQAKLFVRNFQHAVCLAELSLAGAVAVDTSETRFNVRRLWITLNNPRFSFFDDICNYLSTHRPEPSSDSSSTSKRSPKKEDSAQRIIQSLSQLFDLKFEIDSLVLQFIAAKPARTLSVTVAKTNLEFVGADKRSSVKLRSIALVDQASTASFMRCVRIDAAAIVRGLTSEAENETQVPGCDLSCNISQPTLSVYQQDLIWWTDYASKLDLSACFSWRSSGSLVDHNDEKFADDFSRDYKFDKSEAAIKQQKRAPSNIDSFQLTVQVELSDFHGQLRGQDGAALAFGVELATFSGELSHRERFEFGVESLWCHRANSDAVDFRFQPSQYHYWGTTVAVGAGLVELSRTSNGVFQLLIQLDECRFEWEDSTVMQLVGFVDLFCRISAAKAAPSPPELPKSRKPMERDDSWSSIAEDASRTSATEKLGGLIIKISAKRLNVFLTARQSVFVVASVDNWRVDVDAAGGIYSTTLEGLHIGESEIRRFAHFPDDWWLVVSNAFDSGGIHCGRVERLSMRYVKATNEFTVFDLSSIELTWSVSVHLVFYETYCTVKRALGVLRGHLKTNGPEATVETPTSSARPFLISMASDSPLELGFRLPGGHLMRWVVPSFSYEKADNFWILTGPTFFIETDSHIVLNVERPAIRAAPADVGMNLNRQEFKQLVDKTNRVWTWSALAFELLFPYGYDFSAAYESVINAIKWIKKVHGLKSKAFPDHGRLPADVRIQFKQLSLRMNDDPFEIKLQNIYDVMMDEVFERERRRQTLEVKISQLKKDDPLFPKAKVDALYASLMKKDAQIYVERIRKVQQQQRAERCLLSWVWRDVDVRIYADSGWNSAADVVQLIRRLNGESPLPADAEFSTLWARAVELDVVECRLHFRDYPLSYVLARDAHFWGQLAAGEAAPAGPNGERAIRRFFVDAPPPWGCYDIERNMCPLKFYYDMVCEIDEMNSTYGPCWEPCLSMISLCWNLVNAPSKDPSDPLPFWDKSRLLLHGQFSMMCKRLVTSMLASPDPYNDTELVELAWERFEFDWTAGEFRIQTDLDAFVRTASKYDDSRLFRLPRCKFAIQLDWDCLGDQHDHHAITPCAPDKLPEYFTNIKHDSFRAFRSNSVSATVRFEVKPPPTGQSQCQAGQCPQILFYANTFKCLEFMKNTLTTVYRPVRRGRLFNNEAPIRRAPLSTHLQCVNLSVTLPRFLISYWMSFSSPYGFRMVSDSLNLTMAAILRNSQQVDKNDGISRRSHSSWKVSHMSAQLEKAEIHLYGDKRQPTATADDGTAGSDDASFFIGLSRLNYVREWNPKSGKAGNMSALTAMPGLTSEAAEEKNVVHRLIAHDLKASWTIDNRDICLVIAEGVQRAHILRKILDNEAMKVFKFNYDQPDQKPSNFTASTPLSTCSNTDSPPAADDADDLLRRLVDEARTNLVAYSEETVDPPTGQLHGVALCAADGCRLTNWQIDLLNSQLVLRGCARRADSFVLVTAARTSVTQRFYYPIWRHAQLLLKRSWCAVLSGMQYFAPVVVGQDASGGAEFRWLSREIIEEKALSDPSMNDKVNNYSSTGEAVGGVVADPFLKNYSHPSTSSATATDEDASDPPSYPELQLQRVASRCSCQLFFCYFSDTINMEKTEEEDICIPAMSQSPTTSDNSTASWGSHEHKRRFDEVDCFTLKHNMLEVSTNADQYQMIIDIVNSLILFVDPKKTRAEENRRRLWFRLVKTPKRYVKEQIVHMQSELREVVSIVRSLERQSYFLNKELLGALSDLSLCSASEQLKAEIEECKAQQNALVDDLATMISCYKEKEVEEAAEAHRLRAVHERIQRRVAADADEDPFDAPQALTARRFEVCFEDCIWRLTESDGQLALAEMQIRNFLYTRTARIDNSGDHLLEIGMVKVLNLLPNSKYKETLARLPVDAAFASVISESNAPSTERTPSIRVICRELPPVGGISIKEHFEVNIAPMNAQMTYRFFEKMMAFFFPGRNIDKEDQQNLDVADDQQSQQSFSLARRLRGAVNHSFRASSTTQTAISSGSSADGVAPDASSLSSPVNDEIDKMKERAKKNNMFLYIIIPPVPFVVSYKGNKEKNIEDVDRFDITFPIFEYHDRNWTWLDMALAIKQRCKRIILPQLLKQKLLRKRILGAERASIPNIDTVDEDEKRRIVLGVTATNDKTARKRKT